MWVWVCVLCVVCQVVCHKRPCITVAACRGFNIPAAEHLEDAPAVLRYRVELMSDVINRRAASAGTVFVGLVATSSEGDQDLKAIGFARNDTLRVLCNHHGSPRTVWAAVAPPAPAVGDQTDKADVVGVVVELDLVSGTLTTTPDLPGVKVRPCVCVCVCVCACLCGCVAVWLYVAVCASTCRFSRCTRVFLHPAGCTGGVSILQGEARSTAGGG